MKTANIKLHLDKNTTVTMGGVTPIEAMILVAEHHKNRGGTPVEVIEETKDKDAEKRTEDQEIARLRGKYHGSKLKTVLTEIRKLPEDYKDAIEKGLSLVFPDKRFASESGTAPMPPAKP